MFDLRLTDEQDALVATARDFAKKEIIPVAGKLDEHGTFPREIFEQAHLPITESDLLVVQLPDGPQPLLQICKALLVAELNVHYAYPVLIGPQGHAALALHVEDIENAAHTLQRHGFVLFTENDLSP